MISERLRIPGSLHWRVGRPPRPRVDLGREQKRPSATGATEAKITNSAASSIAIGDQFLHALSSISLQFGNHVGVGVHGQGDLRMTENIHYNSRRDALELAGALRTSAGGRENVAEATQHDQARGGSGGSQLFRRLDAHALS